MQLIQASVTNFGSYKNLEINFQKQGLTLLSGPTGAGKSTFCDVVPWILFGKTAKDGAADEVRSWGTEQQTSGVITLTINGKMFQVGRYRNPNDLIIWEDGGAYRGKDLNDTQKLINSKLGLSYDKFIASAYYHEFCQTAGFFTANAKVRRVLTESLVDLSLPIHLNENLTEYRKELKAEKQSKTDELTGKRHQIDFLKKALSDAKKRSGDWDNQQQDRIKVAEGKSSSFEADQTALIAKMVENKARFELDRDTRVKSIEDEIASLTAQIKPDSYFTEQEQRINALISKLDLDKCGTCGAPKSTDKKARYVTELHVIDKDRLKNKQLKHSLRGPMLDLKSFKKSVNPYLQEIQKETARVNVYREQLEQLRKEKNPFTLAIIDSGNALFKSENELDTLQKDVNVLVSELSDIDLLIEIIAEFRAVLVKNTIIELERSTNKLLTSHFTAEFRVKFEVEEADKLEVYITKDGNDCSYSQLSKGQRCLLKLCFGTSVMSAVSNHSGVDVNTVYLDEALDGLDDNFKLQAYNLLAELALIYENVYVVDHNASLASMFSKQLKVQLVNGSSEIEQA